MLRPWIKRATALDSYYSLAQWVRWAIVGISTGGSAAVSWAFSTLEKFWAAYGWAGIASVAVVAWLLIAVSLLVTVHPIRAARSHGRGLDTDTTQRPSSKDESVAFRATNESEVTAE